MSASITTQWIPAASRKNVVADLCWESDLPDVCFFWDAFEDVLELDFLEDALEADLSEDSLAPDFPNVTSGPSGAYDEEMAQSPRANSARKNRAKLTVKPLVPDADIGTQTISRGAGLFPAELPVRPL